jgi:transposase
MHPKYQEVIKLRKRGKSYREIAKITNVSKSSISVWCKNLKLPKLAQKILEKKMRKSMTALVKYNRLKSERVKKEDQKIKQSSIKEIQPLSKYELKLIGTALYWAEGYKRQEKESSPYICFVNSDPKMIKLFLRFLREIIQIPNEKLRLNIRIHPNINDWSTIKFWSKIAKIPKEKFRISRQISRSSKGKRPQKSLPYGTLKITVSGRQNFFKIKGWIEGITKQVI